MRLIALVESLDHVCCRYRLAAFRPYLEAAEHSLDLVPLPRGWLARLRLFRELGSADAVVLQRKLLPALQLAFLRRSTRRLIFDFDDAVWLRDSYHPRGLASRRRLARFRRTIQSADFVIAGNRSLADAAALDCGLGRLAVIPTCVNPTDYPVASHLKVEGLRLVWVGSSSTLRGLERTGSVLAEVGRAVPGVQLKLICDRFVQFDGLSVDLVRWDSATEAREIAASDVGLAWAPDDDWSRGKCGLKVLQYMAAGLPVIANPVGMHREFVRHGESGFLVETTADWVTAATRLAADPVLRKRMGDAGRSRLESEFSTSVGGRLWVESIGRLAGATSAVWRRSG